MVNFTDTPVATITFILMIGLSIWGLLKNPEIIRKSVFRPYDFYHNKKYFSIISSGFVHGDFPHLLFNGITYFFFAFQIERAYGSLQFLLIYYLSLIISDLPSLYKYKDDYRYGSLGASGAISGVLFSYILLNPWGQLGIMIIPFVPIPAFIFGILYLIWEQYSSNRGDGVNHSAHFWGAIAGLLLTIILVPGILDNFIFRLFGE